MKTLLQHNKNRKSNNTNKWLLVVSIIAIAVFGLDFLLGGSIRSLMRNFAAGAWGMSASVSMSVESSGLFNSRRQLAGENIALRSQIASLQSLSFENAILKEENESLRKLAKVAESRSGAQTYSVLSHSDVSPYGTFIINGGSADGVTAGSLVLAEGGVLIGTIESVGVNTSLVLTIFAPERTVTARLGDSTEAIVSGRGGGNGELSVPRDVEVEEGDFVYYEAGGEIIGQVGAIFASPANAEKRLLIRTPINLYGLRFVTVAR